MAADPTQFTRTCMLVGNPYDDRLDVRTDVAIIYGHQNYLPRAQKWQEKNYGTHFMTALTGGSYDDYFSGKYDGEKHYHERQQLADGTRLEKKPSVYQLIPTPEFIDYLKTLIKSVIDAGATAIYLADPEYPAETGYSTVFKEHWRSYYGEAWQDPWTSVQTRFMSGRLKYHIFLSALDKLFQYAREYALSIGKNIECYAAIQSLISLTHWGIVTPQSQIVNLPFCNGILAKVSTSTARTPNIFAGIRGERTFETALLEYGVFVNLAKGTDRQLIFMQDPVEDDEENSWEDYRENYESTVAASLFYPEVSRYLSLPWPKRIFTAQYSRTDGRIREKTPIPAEYAREILIVNNTLRNIDQPKIALDSSYAGVGILLSDTMMFQRGGPSSSDSDLSFFYGIAMPLLKHGIFPHPLPMENLIRSRFLDDIHILFLSYSAMKPLRPEYHAILAEWVKAGHVLIYIDDLKDPFNKIQDWWNTPPFNYDSPALHLFELLGLGQNPSFDDVYFVGRGRVILRQANPVEFAQSMEKAKELLDLIRHSFHLLSRTRLRLKTQNYIRFRRGPYQIAAVFDETASFKPLHLRGKLIDLFDPDLSYSRSIELFPGERGFFINLSWIDRYKPRLIVSASSVQNIKREKGIFSFTSTGPTNIQCITKIFMPRKPRKIIIMVNGAPYPNRYSYERFRKILTLQYENCAAEIKVVIHHPEVKYRINFNFIKKWFPFLQREDREWS